MASAQRAWRASIYSKLRIEVGQEFELGRYRALPERVTYEERAH
jgi:hypothetical protein